jgi:DNA-3-methyladenine glycosylase
MSQNDIAPGLPRAFFERDPVAVAQELVGCRLISGLGGESTSGRIIEVEAYRGADDLASHAARLRTGRVLVMREQVGIAYVYRSYGIHAMLNVVAHAPGETGAILIRALQPLDGIEVMRRRRGGLSDRDLCSGPGKLCISLGISLNDHGIDLTRSEVLRITTGDRTRRAPTLASARIGISKATDLPWRFFEAGNPFVSAHRRGTVVGTGSDIIP